LLHEALQSESLPATVDPKTGKKSAPMAPKLSRAALLQIDEAHSESIHGTT